MKVQFHAPGLTSAVTLEVPDGLEGQALYDAIRDAANAHPGFLAEMEVTSNTRFKIPHLQIKSNPYEDPSTDHLTDGHWFYIFKVQARTQKALGIQALGSMVPSFKVFTIESVKPSDLVGKFARPCPLTPRHGFVDSRLINTLEEAQKIIDETRSADPLAEIVTMEAIKAEYSAVWTPGTLTVGPSNDGATQGHNALRIPAIGDKYPNISQYLLHTAGITESPYVELLWKKNGNAKVVQLRNGPKLPSSLNFIPQKTKVESVILAEGDLLEWEAKIKSAAPGTVVYHPGGSLASHYAVHAVIAGMPVLIDQEPHIGDVLEPDTKVYSVDINQIRAGFYTALIALTEENMEWYRRYAYLMLSALHNLSVWKGQYDFFIGLGMGAAFRLSAMASIGEARHALKGVKPQRSELYGSVWNKILEHRVKLRNSMAKFSDPYANWPGSNFGGQKWFDFMLIGIKMFNAVRAGNVESSLMLFNELVHAAHNSGWAFNKFLSEEDMNEAARNPLTALIPVAPVFYKFAAEFGREARVKAALGMAKLKPMSIDPAKAKEKAESLVAKYTSSEEENGELWKVVKLSGTNWDDTYWAAGPTYKLGKGVPYGQAIQAVATASKKNPTVQYMAVPVAQKAVRIEA